MEAEVILNTEIPHIVKKSKMEYNLPLPNVAHRWKFGYTPTRGDVVAFYWETDYSVRTGIMIMESDDEFLAAVNLYKEENRIWQHDQLPEGILLFEATDEEKEWGLRYFFDYYYGNCTNEHPVIAFVEGECAEILQRNEWRQDRICLSILTYLPKWGYVDSDGNLISKLWKEAIKGANAGLAFNQMRAELYCFLIAVMMITQHCEEQQCWYYIKKLYDEWDHFAWMYSMVIGRLIGTGLKTFTSMVNTLDNSKRSPYLHLYLPLVEGNVDKICMYSSIEKRYKLEAAINKMKLTEQRIEQVDLLDDLFGILFPKHFRKMMNESRPASTIKEMKEELAKKDEQINHWKKAAEDLAEQVNQLTEGMKTRVEESLSMEDVKAAILSMQLDVAKMVFSNLDFKLRKNEVWRNGRDLLLDKLEEKENAQNATSIATNNGIVAGGNLNANLSFTNDQVKMLIEGLSLNGEQSKKLLTLTANGNNNTR